MSDVKSQAVMVNTITMLFLHGPQPETEVLAECRDHLVDTGFIDRSSGWVWLTAEGVEFALNCLHLGPLKMTPSGKTV